MDANKIPQLLLLATRWLLWLEVPNPKPGKKPLKVPYYINGNRRNGELDSPEDIARLASFDDAQAALKSGNYTGLGFALGKDGDGYWQGIDLDGLSDHPDLQELVDDLPGYVETSPSGDGVHAIGYGDYFQSLGSNKSGVEAYSTGRYFTFTGDTIRSGEIVCLAAFVESRLKPIHSPPKQTRPANIVTNTIVTNNNISSELLSALDYFDPDDRDEWQRVGHALKVLGSEGLDVWLSWSMQSDKHDHDADLKTWESFKPTRISYQAIFAEAQRRGWINPRKASYTFSGDRGLYGEFGGYLDSPDIPNQITDTRVAEYFAKACQLVRYWADAKKWLVYDGMRWSTNNPGGAFPLFKHVLGELYDKARQIPDDNLRQNMLKSLIGLESHKRQETLLAAASVVPDMIVQSCQLDRDPMVLNCLNGTLDLSTGNLREHKPDDYITRLVHINYDPAAECPIFIRFLDRIFEGKKDLIAYLQRFVGYCLTGKTIEQVFIFFFGMGCNGKSVFATVIEKLLGDFASTADSSLLMQRDNRSASNDLAGLRGARLVKVSEFNDGERLAEATVKTLTGGDRVSCRFLYGEFFEYTPAYKILLLGNYKPKIRGRDHGIWRRIHLVPFNVTIPEHERDDALSDKLHAELPGILAWAVRGCLEWQRVGLQPPAEVLNEVQAYKQSEDVFSQWLDECCIEGDEHATPSKELLASFCEFSGWKNLSATRFGRLLADAGFIKEKANVIKWRGVALSEGQLGQWDSFSVKSRETKLQGKFTENGLNYPNHPNPPEVDASLEVLTNG